MAKLGGILWRSIGIPVLTAVALMMSISPVLAGTATVTLSPLATSSTVPNIAAPGVQNTTFNTNAIGPFNYAVTTFTVDQAGTYTATSTTPVFQNTTFFLKGVFTPGTPTPTPLSNFLVSVYSGNFSPLHTATFDGTGLSLVPGQQYSVLIAFNENTPTPTDAVTLTINGPGCIALGSNTCTTVTSLAPSSGPTAGGTSVTITGTNFTGATAVSFGGTAATGCTVDSATQITATAPAGSAGTVDVTVTTAGGTSAISASDQFTYVAAPTVSAVSPNWSPTAGGTSVTITGTNFTGATAVRFGGTAATGYTVDSATQITATAPAGTGTVDVRVTTAGGTSATSASDQFTYVAAPTVSAVSPNSGPAAGGTSVVITGTNLTAATAVRFGSTNAASYTVNSATQITATSPSGSAGMVDIAVTTAGGTSTTSVADQFTYVAAPTVTSLAPSSGSNAGGTSVVITGTGFSGATAVKFGSANATSYTVNSATQISATAPAGSSGVVDVTVVGPGGTSATGTSDQFTYVYQSFTGPTPGGGTATAIISSGGGANCHYTLAQFVAVSTVGTAPPPGYVFNQGLFDFALAGCTNGQAVTVTITYSSDPGSVYWKFGPTTSDPTPHWYTMPNTAGASANIAGNVATLVITDGGIGDDDRTANGNIVDAGGPASPMGAVAAIPTLSDWAKLMMAVLLIVSLWLLQVRAGRHRPLTFKRTRHTRGE